MNTPKDFRPFNLEHAKAGAPVGRKNGGPIRIICFDRKNEGYPIVVLYEAGDKEHLASYRESGKGPYSDLVMLPLGYIDGKPVFVGDTLEAKTSVWFDFTVGPEWEAKKHFEYRWPKKKVIKEVWQPQWVYPDLPYPYVAGTGYQSEADCVAANGQSSGFLKAVKTGEYEVEE